jgi:hypothetical protein
MGTESPEGLAAGDGEELVRLLNELTTRVALRSPINDIYVHYHVGSDGGNGWRVRVVGVGEAPPQVWLMSAGVKGGLLDALRERVAALQEEQEPEPRAKPPAPAKSRERKAPAKPRRRVAR